MITQSALVRHAWAGWEHTAQTGASVRAGSAAATGLRSLRGTPFAFLIRAAYRAVLNKSCGDPLISGGRESPESHGFGRLV